MQHISEKWLKRINYCYIIYCCILLSLYAYVAFQQQKILITPIPELGISITTGFFSLLTILYSLVLLKTVRKYNVWVAYLAGYVLVGVTNAAQTELTLNTSIGHVFIALNYIYSLLSITLGPVTGLTIIGINGVITGMVVAGTVDPTKFGKNIDVLAYLVRTIFISLGLFLLRNKYVTETGKQNYIEKYFVTNEVVSLLTDSLSDGVIIIDQNEVIQSVNPAAQKILGQNAKDLIDLNYRSVLKLKNTNQSNVDAENEPIFQALKTGKSANKDFLIMAADNQEAFIDISISVINDPQSKTTYGAIIILRDVSKKKREEAARSEFISTASHEMRTPVAAIEGFIELALNEKVSTIDANARKYLIKASSSAQHLGRLFQDLLVSAKAEDGRISNHPTVVELGELLEQQSEVSRMVAQQKGLKLEYVISSGDSASKENRNTIRPLYYVIADPDRIREVATNLIDNAMKYTNEGQITLGVTGDNDIVQFFIKDTGVGIAEEDIPHLFQKFYRIDSSDTRTTGGTGLGLFICRKIIELYKGRIWVESQKGKGTTFFVNIPRVSSLQAEATKANLSSQDKIVSTGSQ